MAASKDRTMIDGIYTDMIIGVDTETPSQRMNVTWGETNQNIDIDNPMPVLSVLSGGMVELMLRQIENQKEIIRQLKISNKYNEMMHDEVITEEDLE